MANLGDNNTPVEGESFGLPSGYSFDEENGDLVIRDTDGTVAMRRADGAAWQLEGSDISAVGAFDSESVNTEQASIENGPVLRSSNGWDWGFDGADSDSRLDNAISAASSGDTIYLEVGAEYAQNRTISKRLDIVGSSPDSFVTEISGQWTLNERVRLINCTIRDDCFMNELFCRIHGSTIEVGSTVTISESRCFVTDTRTGEVVFEEGTSQGLVDSCVDMIVTDNGDNTVGDVT